MRVPAEDRREKTELGANDRGACNLTVIFAGSFAIFHRLRPTEKSPRGQARTHTRWNLMGNARRAHRPFALRRT